MIFFYIRSPNPGRVQPSTVPIPLLDNPSEPDSVTKLSHSNVSLVSWNEISCVIDDQTIPVENLAQLQALVTLVARQDPVCIEMNRKSSVTYGVCAFDPGEPFAQDNSVNVQELIERIFFEWAHPMIGNILLSPVTRPQVVKDQYNRSWNTLQYIDAHTKQKIRDLLGVNEAGDSIDPPPPGKMADLNRSSHDQVRICPDLTTLARAIVGEITTIVTRRIEKLYALDLCRSPSLYAAQKTLIKELLAKLMPPPPAAQSLLKTYFFSQHTQHTGPYGAPGLSRTEYIKFYFVGCVLPSLTLEAQWSFYVALIELAIDEENIPGLVRGGTHTADIAMPNVAEWLRQWRGFPPIVRCAVALNSLRRFVMHVTPQFLANTNYRYSTIKTGDNYSYAASAKNSFCPRFETPDLRLLWSWNRDEKHPTTETSRQHLLPLWGGPSGHSHGHLDVGIGWLGRLKIRPAAADIDISAVILSSLFLFWRLYYDKRISAIHTIVETYEASIASACLNADLTRKEALPDAPQNPTALAITAGHADDVFSLVLACQNQDQGVINPIRLMNSLSALYYTPIEGTAQVKFDALKRKLDALRDTLSVDYYIPLWSKPILPGPQIEGELAGTIEADLVLKLIRIFSTRNVRVYSRPAPPPPQDALFFAAGFAAAPIYGESFSLAEHYSDIPKTIDGAEVLSLITIENISSPQTTEKGIFFTGEVATSAAFWETAAFFTQLDHVMAVSCHISPDSVSQVFSMRADIAARYKITDSFSVSLEAISLTGGLDSRDRLAPYLTFECSIGKLKAEIITNVGSRRAVIRGHFGGENVFTLSDMAELFGLSGSLSFLPKELSEAIFGNLGLLEFNITLNIFPLDVETIDFTLCAQNDWKLMGDKITLKPFLSISIDRPFDSKDRDIDVTISGVWQLGSTRFYTAIAPASGDIVANMPDGEALDITAVMKSFAPGLSLPQISIDTMRFFANYKSGSYEISLAAEKALQFSVCGAEAGIKDTNFHLVYEDGAIGQFELSGTFFFGGISLALQGKYRGSDDWEFSANGSTDASLSLSGLLANAAAEYPSLSVVTNSLPQNFLPFTIGSLYASYTSKTNETTLRIVLGRIDISDHFAIDGAMAELLLGAGKIGASCGFGFKIAGVMRINDSQIFSCEYKYDKTDTEKQNAISLKYHAKTKDDTITLADILSKMGFADIDSTWDFITSIGISEAALSYDFSLKRLSGGLKISSGGELEISFTFGAPPSYSVTVSSTVVLSLSDVPIVGGLTQKLLPAKDNFSVRDLTFYALSHPDKARSLPAGLRLGFAVLGETRHWQIYENKKNENAPALIPSSAALASSEKSAPKVYWLKIEKNLAIFTLHRLGLGLDGSYLMVVLDASLSVSPFTFKLFGAGIGVSISDFSLKFYISGFGVSFDNGVLVISGEFYKDGNVYSGLMLVQIKQISVFAVAQYSEDGSLFAYAVLSARIGGPPAFFVTGLALGFGYHKRIVMPDIDHVADYPLIRGAMGKIGRESMITELNKYILDAKGQKFLAAGIKFTSFEIAESFVLLTVSFGADFEINLLGLSDISMPPRCAAPIARAQLALKASFRPAEGFFGVEARLTSESYILSKNCRLTGGFAFFLWFGGEHSGDFVITLGGYHPKYLVNKPTHYPDVPRIGFNWSIGDNVKISGDIYFALTPGALMAGGRLSATYTRGNFKAYFIAKADFLISWKPFYYDIEIGVTLGASYRLDLWLCSTTIKLEFGVDLHIWGPEFSGEARIDLWIISFTMRFGANAPKGAPALTWGEFRDSFLPKEKQGARADISSNSSNGEKAAPIKISFGAGLNGRIITDGREVNSLSPGGTEIVLDTVIPITSASLNGAAVPFSPVSVIVKPMKNAGKAFEAGFSAKVTAADGTADRFTGAVTVKNLPAAMWGEHGEILPNIPCGLRLVSAEPELALFPQKQNISLDDLYLRGATVIKNAFSYMNPGELPDYTDRDSISVFKRTANSSEVIKRRAAFLKSLGIDGGQSISLEKFSTEADRYFDEEVLIPIL